MTGAELEKARQKLGVSGGAFAAAFDVSVRTLRGWETGSRDGKPVPVPRLVAILTRLALKDRSVRRELGLSRAKAPRTGPRPRRRPRRADGHRDAGAS